MVDRAIALFEVLRLDNVLARGGRFPPCGEGPGVAGVTTAAGETLPLFAEPGLNPNAELGLPVVAPVVVVNVVRVAVD
jgi:hypothetical protein